jgi:hypothetical protein
MQAFDNPPERDNEVLRMAVVQGAQFEYAFDMIGNRTSAKSGTTNAPTAAYTANNLNQYTAREVPGVVEVNGVAVTGAAVTVQVGTNAALSANRHGEYFWKTLDAANSSSGFFTTNVNITARLTNEATVLVRTEMRSARVPQGTPTEAAEQVGCGGRTDRRL